MTTYHGTHNGQDHASIYPHLFAVTFDWQPPFGGVKTETQIISGLDANAARSRVSNKGSHIRKIHTVEHVLALDPKENA